MKSTRCADSSLQIGEIKSYFEEHEDDFEQQARKVDYAINPPAEPHMLQDSPDQWDLDTALPPREAVDTLVASYFAADSPVRRVYPSGLC